MVEVALNHPISHALKSLGIHPGLPDGLLVLGGADVPQGGCVVVRPLGRPRRRAPRAVLEDVCGRRTLVRRSLSAPLAHQPMSNVKNCVTPPLSVKLEQMVRLHRSRATIGDQGNNLFVGRMNGNMPEAPNVLFLMDDEHRPDVLGFAGDDVVLFAPPRPGRSRSCSTSRPGSWMPLRTRGDRGPPP